MIGYKRLKFFLDGMLPFWYNQTRTNVHVYKVLVSLFIKNYVA